MIIEARQLMEDIERAIKTLSVTRQHSSFTQPFVPLFKLRRKSIEGEEVFIDSFRPLRRIRHNKTVAAVDSSLKLIMDLGAFKIYLVKIAGAVFRGAIHEKSTIMLRLGLVTSREEALRLMMKYERQVAAELLEENAPSYLMLDGSLNPIVEGLKEDSLIRLLEKAEEYGCRVLAFAKSSRIVYDDVPISLILDFMARHLGLSSWICYPLLHRGRLTVAMVKLSPDSRRIFRLDIWGLGDVLTIASEIAYLQDDALPGYPYPLVRAHRDSRIEKAEAEYVRCILEEKISLRDLDTVSFRRNELEGWSRGVG
ncbi:MAG: hypothetical protein DRN15_01840 [Thermoprotei archaeon]|nr:MAG: hypothetical protein DRM97_04300 [Thermoprotei archaeon]RLF24705.1 MAG: hypothetical protein DRN15_01840 [Thermoprotei archaeon]